MRIQIEPKNSYDGGNWHLAQGFFVLLFLVQGFLDIVMDDCFFMLVMTCVVT